MYITHTQAHTRRYIQLTYLHAYIKKTYIHHTRTYIHTHRYTHLTYLHAYNKKNIIYITHTYIYTHLMHLFIEAVCIHCQHKIRLIGLDPKECQYLADKGCTIPIHVLIILRKYLYIHACVHMCV